MIYTTNRSECEYIAKTPEEAAEYFLRVIKLHGRNEDEFYFIKQQNGDWLVQGTDYTTREFSFEDLRIEYNNMLLDSRYTQSQRIEIANIVNQHKSCFVFDRNDQAMRDVVDEINKLRISWGIED